MQKLIFLALFFCQLFIKLIQLFIVEMGKTHVDSLVRLKFKDFVGEFDPGSGRTLAVRLMHASRAKLFSSLLQKMTERRTGE